jgi:hypothetical protein
MMRITYVPAHHLDRERIALRGPHGRHVAAGPRSSPAIHSRSPSPIAAETVPLRIATARAAFAGRIASVSARRTGAPNPAIVSWIMMSAIRSELRPPNESNDNKTEDADRQTEHDLDETLEAARDVAERATAQAQI